jgi:uncharacterized protein (TIGR02266 family)
MLDVLIIDPDQATRDELRIVTQACGRTVEVCASARSGLEVLHALQPRVLVVELILPDVDGFSLCQRLRDDAQHDDLKILCISSLAWGTVDLASLLQRRFCAKYLAKGSLYSDYIRTLDRLLGGSVSEPPVEAGAILGGHEQAAVRTMTEEFEAVIAARSWHPRASVRFEVEFEVTFDTGKQLATEFTKNISRGGLFIVTKDPPPMDAMVEITLRLPHINRDLNVSGRVVHRVLEARPNSPMGFGLQFENLSKEIKEMLGNLATRLSALDSSKEPEPAPQWVVIAGLPPGSLMGRSSGLGRKNVRLIELPGIDEALDFSGDDPSIGLVVAHSALGKDPRASLARVRDLFPRSPCVLVGATDPSFEESGLCRRIVPAGASIEQTIDIIEEALGLVRRREARIPCDAPAMVTVLGGERTARLVDLSVSGALLKTDGAVPSASLLRMHFVLHKIGPIDLRGLVVRQFTSEQMNFLGVGFYDVDDEMREKLRRFAQSNVNFREYFDWMKKRRFG